MKVQINLPSFIYAKGLLVGLIAVMLMAACNFVDQTATTEGPTENLTGSPTSAPTLTATAVPPKILNICVAEEPLSLFRYDGRSSTAKESVFAALYDGPFEIDPSTGEYAPSILETLPDPENGAIRLVSVPVQAGDVVVDAYGSLSVFKQGLLVRPAGCLESSCAVAWDGNSDFSMDQMLVKFTLLDGLKWSDGEPLTAQDSHFSYQLAQEAALPASQWALERTDAYSAQDNRTVLWQGVPGFTSNRVAEFFWEPMPEHILGGMGVTKMAEAENAAHLPTGWGAYRITAWDAGQALHFEKNPYYFRLEEGLPYFDLLSYLVIPQREQALQMLSTGECDLLDSSYDWQNLDKTALTEIRKTANLYIQNWEPVEQLVFGINPATYDNGYSIWDGDRPDYLGDLRTRQAIVACIDPANLAETLLRAKLPEGIILPQYENVFSETNSGALLEEVGWSDSDNDPGTPRTSAGVAGILDQTPFVLKLITGQSQLDEEAARLIVEGLGACGIQVEWQPVPVTTLYAPGPGGQLFGRQFDLALVTWQPLEANPCRLYLSDAIPNSENGWIGTNLAGFSDQTYDLACGDLQLESQAEASSDDWSGLNSDLPAIPLLPQIELWLSKLDLEIPSGGGLEQLEAIRITGN